MSNQDIKIYGKKKLQFKSISCKTQLMDNFSLNELRDPSIFDQPEKRKKSRHIIFLSYSTGKE